MADPRPYCARPGCTNRLKGQQRKFCSNSCRATFANSQRFAEDRRLAESVALEEMREKIAPVVREMLTEKVLLELEALTELLPKAVARLARLLESEDDDTALKAATLLLKYTMGNSSIAPPPLEQSGTRLELNIGIPQQNGSTRDYTIEGEVVDAEPMPAEDARECMDCHEVKPAEDFMGQSQRCQACHDEMLEQVQARFGKLPVLRSQR